MIGRGDLGLLLTDLVLEIKPSIILVALTLRFFAPWHQSTTIEQIEIVIFTHRLTICVIPKTGRITEQDRWDTICPGFSQFVSERGVANDLFVSKTEVTCRTKTALGRHHNRIRDALYGEYVLVAIDLQRKQLLYADFAIFRWKAGMFILNLFHTGG